MNILIIGAGGREHAIAWKVAQSPRVRNLYALPGNPGIAQLAEIVEDVRAEDHPGLIRFCKQKQIDLVVVGPEVYLANGMVDALVSQGIRCFGPNQAAAQIETSKVFCKNFMARHGIPTARFAAFDQLPEALSHLEKLDYPIVIKASGLAAGKGVILPESVEEARAALIDIMEKRVFGEAGSQVVIEERLTGPEVSLMAFTDGQTVLPMLPAQDHKRLLDGDSGPNTGGMGAYAPAPVFTPAMLAESLASVLQPAVDGMRAEGMPFVGVLYAGLMLTPKGIRVLEFNCRFGDPETQVVLPLLETDLLDVMEACVDGRLAQTRIVWKSAACACVILASQGYPEKAETGKPIHLAPILGNGVCFQAGTRENKDGEVVTAGGRVLGVTAWDQNLSKAVTAAYKLIGPTHFDGMQYRSDIARRALGDEPVEILPAPAHNEISAYASAGVSIEAGNQAVELMKAAVKSTYTPAVLGGFGSFGGLFQASFLKEMQKPVLVASTDGVGTKVKLAAAVGRYTGIGRDIVNHCINDILVQGARPLFFMDYFATARLRPEQTAAVVTGIAEACRAVGMVLLGGETAEMPGVYAPDEFDVAGTIVGVVEQDHILPRTSQLKAGDVLLGLQSSGPHTNGYSLIRQVFADTPLESRLPELDGSLADILLASHRSYLNLLYPQLANIKALAHLTGGGHIENIPRVLPAHLDAQIRVGSWPVPPLWNLIQKKGSIAREEMYRVFNMGIGMVAIVDAGLVDQVQKNIPEETYQIGRLVAGQGRVRLVD